MGTIQISEDVVASIATSACLEVEGVGGLMNANVTDYVTGKKLTAKGIELDALSRNPNAKPETLSKLANEVAELRSQLRAERMTPGYKIEKDLGAQPGRGMMGNGMGYHNGGRHGGGHGGHGGHGGGNGSNCNN